MKIGFFLKLGIAIVAGFGLLIAGFYAWKPLTITYYKYRIGSEDKEAHLAAVKYLLEADAVAPVKYYYENKYASKDVHERLAVVDEFCSLGENGKKLMYDIFRARCMKEQVLIPAGSFMMGFEKGVSLEKPAHKVRISAFAMDKYEVTNEKYYTFVKCANHHAPDEWDSTKLNEGLELHPVSCVSWEDANEYTKWLKMRLPTEAEWEYACRADSNGEYCFGDNVDELGEYAWYENNSEKQTHAVGTKKPNKWGLYDMHGNVHELVKDWYDPGYYSSSPMDDPQGPRGPLTFRVTRGGGWYSTPYGCRSSYRYSSEYSDLCSGLSGFRLCHSAGE